MTVVFGKKKLPPRLEKKISRKSELWIIPTDFKKNIEKKKIFGLGKVRANFIFRLLQLQK